MKATETTETADTTAIVAERIIIDQSSVLSRTSQNLHTGNFQSYNYFKFKTASDMAWSGRIDRNDMAADRSTLFDNWGIKGDDDGTPSREVRQLVTLSRDGAHQAAAVRAHIVTTTARGQP
jgi:hypothetical protein